LKVIIMKNIVQLLLLLFLISCQIKTDKRINEEEVKLLTQEDTTLRHTLFFIGDFNNNRLLILDNREIVRDKILGKDECVAYSTNSINVNVLLLEKKTSFDSTLNLNHFGKYIVLIKEDSSVVISSTNDLTRIQIR